MTPIIYSGDIDVRFGELDPYGHLNAKHYLDYVSSSRLAFLERELDCPIEKIMEHGLGFYLRKATQNFKRPVIGLCRVHQRSHVESASGSLLVVKYELLTEDKQTLYADGELEYAIVDLKTQKPTRPPPWLRALFFKE